jgi:hypothetical protein
MDTQYYKFPFVLFLFLSFIHFIVRERDEYKIESKKVKVNFALEQAMKAQRGSRGIALLFL